MCPGEAVRGARDRLHQVCQFQGSALCAEDQFASHGDAKLLITFGHAAFKQLEEQFTFGGFREPGQEGELFFVQSHARIVSQGLHPSIIHEHF